MMVDLVGSLLQTWERLFESSEDGVVQRARALRGQFLQNLGQTLDLASFALEQADGAASVGGTPLPRANELATVVTKLRSIRQRALSDWSISEEAADQLAKMADIPLRLDKHGDIRIGASRVLLDTIVEHYKAGMPVGEIARAYDTVTLAELQVVIAYYSLCKDDVGAYLERREAEAEAIWKKVESSQPANSELKSQIKERWSMRKADHAAPSAH